MFNCSQESPYLTFNNRNVLAIYDYPHLFKSIRNNLKEGKLITPDGVVNWEVVAFLYNTEKNKCTKMCPKLTYAHIYPTSFQKMSVRLAVQILSHSVASGIRSLLDLNKYPESLKEEAASTATFIEKCNKYFDCLNKPINRDSENVEFLKYMQNYMSSITPIRGKDRSHCFKGISLSTESIVRLIQGLFSKYDINAIDGRKFNQDPLENFYSRIRARNNNKNNPNLFEFSQLFAKLISIKLLFSSKFSNCEDDSDEILTIDWKAVLEYNTDYITTGCEKSQSLIYPTEDNLDLLADENGLELEENIDTCDVATAYFVGYCIYKLLINLKDPCLDCMINMVESEPNCSDSRLILFRYKQFQECRDLIKPSKCFYDICQLHVKIFNNIFKKNAHIKNIKRYIIEKCIEHTQSIDSEWFNNTNLCYNHHVQILDFMILVLLRKNCKWSDKDKVKRTVSKNRKLNAVLNF